VASSKHTPDASVSKPGIAAIHRRLTLNQMTHLGMPDSVKVTG